MRLKSQETENGYDSRVSPRYIHEADPHATKDGYGLPNGSSDVLLWMGSLQSILENDLIYSTYMHEVTIRGRRVRSPG